MVFWSYFKKELRFPPLFSPGPIAMLVEGAAGLLDTVREIVLELRDQFFPSKCEETYLARYAASRGIVRGPQESDAFWLARVRFAYLFWSRGGRASALAEVLCKGFGFVHVDVHFLAQSEALSDETTGELLTDETSGATLEMVDADRWAEFHVTVYLTDDLQPYVEEQVLWAINDVKPARSKLAGVLFVAPLWDETSGEPLFDETGGALLTN